MCCHQSTQLDGRGGSSPCERSATGPGGESVGVCVRDDVVDAQQDPAVSDVRMEELVRAEDRLVFVLYFEEESSGRSLTAAEAWRLPLIRGLPAHVEATTVSKLESIRAISARGVSQCPCLNREWYPVRGLRSTLRSAAARRAEHLYELGRGGQRQLDRQEPMRLRTRA